MFSSFFLNKKWALWAYIGLGILIGSLYIQVHFTVVLNEWYKDFYDILQKTDGYTMNDFWYGEKGSILIFAKIAFPYIFLATITGYFTRIWAFKWREAMTFDYLKFWRNVPRDIEGSSQRIQEDIYRFAKIVEHLGLQIVRALMKLVAFLPILWGLSQHVVLPFIKNVQGSLVWIAILVSVGELIISWFV